VYAIPLVGPHAAWFLGESLLQGFGSNPQIAWMATNVAVAVAAQILAGVVLYWSLGGGWVRKMAWLEVIPLAAALNVAYLSAKHDIASSDIFLVDSARRECHEARFGVRRFASCRRVSSSPRINARFLCALHPLS